ncbi:hypothetical protein SORBI_3010G206501 [Sorghum bicolor]|uniref:Uncharacterized protein n=1 Tax=Sorghum bicolor TaxID=4558 RepID=A0A194YLM6_SORBI|nr:hypothetical protein SORBI_3010G206501 [Sorghum bicolor]
MGGKRVKRINSAPVIRPSRPARHATPPRRRPADGRARSQLARVVVARGYGLVRARPRRLGRDDCARARKPGDPGRKDGQDHCARALGVVVSPGSAGPPAPGVFQSEQCPKPRNWWRPATFSIPHRPPAGSHMGAGASATRRRRPNPSTPDRSGQYLPPPLDGLSKPTRMEAPGGGVAPTP